MQICFSMDFLPMAIPSFIWRKTKQSTLNFKGKSFQIRAQSSPSKLLQKITFLKKLKSYKQLFKVLTNHLKNP